MSEVRCPMCGKPNPEQAETCGFCQARLKPLTVEPAAGDAAGLPDWLTSLGGAGQEQPASPSPSLPVTDWLAGWRRDTAITEGDLEAADDDTDFADFPPVSATDAGTNQPTPEWLKGLLPEVEKADTDQQPAEAARDQPFTASELDWSADLAQGAGEQRPFESVPLPDWLAGFDQPTTPKTPASTEPPALDWLAAEEPPRSAETSASLPPPVEPGSSEAEVVPADEPLEASQLNAAAEEISFPDWLKGINQQSDTPLVQEQKEQPFTVGEQPLSEESQLPDWLNAAEQSLAAESDASDFPDWLAPAAHPSPIIAPVPSGESPAWTLPAGEPASAADDQKARFHFPGLQGQSEIPSVGTGGSAQFDELPPVDLSWLDEMEANTPGVELSSDQPGIPSGEVQVALPGASPEASSTDFQSVIEYTPVSSLPNWLSQADPEEAAPPTEAAESPPTDLTPVELPGWLKSMQPTATMDSQIRATVEGAGPLSGLAGVLPAEPDIVRVTKPAFYSSKLKVSDLQQTQAAILAGLIQTENESKSLPSAPFLTSQGLLRISIGAILLVVMLFSMITGIPALTTPGLSQEVLAVQRLINSLPANAAVLVVVDYSAGYSGELNLLLGALVDHLATKNTALALVSSVPTGPLQVESLIAQVKKRPNFIQPLQYANLGFIPGETAGILAFIQDPTQTLPGPAWNTDGWQHVHTLADFALMVVATENPETARVWIEQARPFASKIPLVLAVSAQAGPLIRPYYDANPQQIQGLLSGYSAAISYDTALGRKTSAAVLWSPFAVGLTVAVLLMGIGILVNLALGALARAREKARSKEQA